MRSFDDLVHEAASADVTGWGFRWLAGRAVEERPPWSYVQLLARRFETTRAALDLDTGGGEVIDEMPVLPPRLVVTESWPPNARAARERLAPRGVQVVETAGIVGLPFDDGTFDLVSSRHPVAPDWPEIARVLRRGGCYFAQHVGPASAFELIEYFLGPLPAERRHRNPQREADAATQAGLVVTDLRTARCRMEFYDVGAVVWILRKCPWWVPGFTVERYRDELVALDRGMRAGTPFVAHSSRHLIEARR